MENDKFLSVLDYDGYGEKVKTNIRSLKSKGYFAAASRKSRKRRRDWMLAVDNRNVLLESEQIYFKHQIEVLQKELQFVQRCREEGGLIRSKSIFLMNESLKKQVQEMRLFTEIIRQNMISLDMMIKDSELNMFLLKNIGFLFDKLSHLNSFASKSPKYNFDEKLFNQLKKKNLKYLESSISSIVANNQSPKDPTEIAHEFGNVRREVRFAENSVGQKVVKIDLFDVPITTEQMKRLYGDTTLFDETISYLSHKEIQPCFHRKSRGKLNTIVATCRHGSDCERFNPCFSRFKDDSAEFPGLFFSVSEVKKESCTFIRTLAPRINSDLEVVEKTGGSFLRAVTCEKTSDPAKSNITLVIGADIQFVTSVAKEAIFREALCPEKAMFRVEVMMKHAKALST